jgi:hypothetical protein
MQKKISALLAVALLAAVASPLRAQDAKAASAAMPKVGDVAPDFALHYFDGTNLKEVKLSDFHGKKNVVLAFYVFAFTGG